MPVPRAKNQHAGEKDGERQDQAKPGFCRTVSCLQHWHFRAETMISPWLDGTLRASTAAPGPYGIVLPPGKLLSQQA